MMKDYDVVVVGAGNAGLSAAIRTQLAGKRTLLIEKNSTPGGCATSFVRGRFEIDPSLHELCDIGPADMPGEVRQLFDEYGVKVNWVEVPDCFRVISEYSDGTPMDVTMPHGEKAFIDKMEEIVPGSREKMETLFEIYEEIRQGTGYISASNGHADSKVLKEKYPNLLRLGAYPVNKVFAALKLPQKCRDILSTYWGYLGVDLDRLAFVHYASMMQRYVRMGAFIPKNTSHEISMAMEERFRELGGETWMGCKANEFLFEDGRLCGVRTDFGDVSCKACLANINPEIIYGKMMPKELIPQREKKLSNARKGNLSARMWTVYFGLNCDHESLGITNYSYFLSKGSDSAKEYESITKGIKENEYCIFLCQNVANRDASPEGTCICSITTMGAPKEWSDLKPEGYFRFKDSVADKMLAILKAKTGIDISGHIEEMAVASPWTFARYLGTPEGAVYGYEVNEWDSMMARMMMLGTDFPIKGLKPIGAAGPRGDGYSATYITGSLVGKLALKDMMEQI